MEKDVITERLNNEIEIVFSAMEDVPAGSEEYKAILNDLKVLYSLRNEEQKILGDIGIRENQLKSETELKEAQINTDYEMKADEAEKSRKWKYVEWVFRALELGIPLIAYGEWQKMGYHYETTGTVRSWTFRELFKHTPKISKLK